MQDENYNDFNLRVVRFIELIDEENNISKSQDPGDTTMNRSNNMKSENLSTTLVFLLE